MKAILKHLAYVPLMFLLVPLSLCAQNFWEQANGPFGGTVPALAINSSGDLFAGTDASGVFRSTDNGNNWTQISNGLPTGASVLALAINSSGELFAGTNGGGVFRSTDNGNNWTQKNSGLTNLYVFSLAINGDGNVFCGTNGSGVFRSTNNGNNWIQMGLTNVEVLSLAINGSGDIFAGTKFDGSLGGVRRSTDNGNTWTPAQRSPSFFSLAINSSGYIFAGAEGSLSNRTGGIYLSTDNGTSYTRRSSGLPIADYQVFSLAINSTGDIFAGTSIGVFRSTNIGTNWAQTGLINRDASSLAINSSGDIFAGTRGGGVFRSTNNGGNWTQISNGLTANYISAFTINSRGDIFAGTFNEGVFRSADIGNNWTQINNGLTNPLVLALAINSGGDIFAGTQGAGVFRSMDNGTIWTQTGLTNSYVNCLAINSGGDIFAGTSTSGGGVVLSTNNGTTWAPTGLINRVVRCLAIDNSSGDIFAGTSTEGVFRSRDNGKNWTRKNSGLPTSSIYSLAINSNGVVFAAAPDAGGGVFRSTNSGDSWTQTSLTNTWIFSLAINSNGVIFAGTFLGGAFRSTNNGDNWTQINNGLIAKYVHSLVINSSGYIFAGTGGSSVFRSVKSTNVSAPTTPTLASPLDGAVNQPTRLTLNWNPATDAETYRLQVSNTSAFTTTVFDDSTITSASRQVGPLANNTAHYWRVKAKNVGGSSAWSSIRSFTTIITAPTAPALASPTNGAVNRPTTLTLSWNPATGAETYRLQVSTNSAFITTVFDDSTITSASRQAGPLANNIAYYWRVKAKNAGGSSAWSNVWSFTTIIAAPSAPALISPANGAGNQSTTLTLSWNPATGATTYRLQVSTSSAFTTTIFDDSTNATTSRQIGLLANNTTYYWRVNAKNVGGTSAWSSVWSFITGTTAVSETGKVTPTEFSLSQNYPNPFNPSTTFLYALPKIAFVRLTIFNPLGKEVETLISTTQVAGEYEIHWNPNNLVSGVYLYRLQAGKFVETRKMVLMR